MSNICRYILLLTTLISGVSAEAEMSEKTFPSTAEYVKTLEENGADKAYSDSMRYKYYFYEAARYKAQGKMDSASALYKKCIEIDSMRSQPYAELAQYYVLIAERQPTSDDKVSLWMVSAAATMSRAVALDSTNTDNLEKHIQYCQQVKDYKNAISSSKKLLELRPDKYYYYALLAYIYTETNQPEEALKVWLHLEELSGYSNQITYNKFAIWVNNLHNVRKGLAEYDKPIKKYPLNASFAIAKAQAYQKVGKYNDAEVFLMKCLKKYPNDISLINLELMTLYMRSQSCKKLDGIVDRVIEDKKTDFEIKSMLIEELQKDSVCGRVVTEQRLKKFIDVYPNEHLAYIHYVNYLSQNGRDEEAYKILEQSLKVNPEQEYAWSLLIEYYAEKKDLMSLNYTIENAVSAMPNSFEFRYRKGRWLLLNNEKEKAIECFKKAVELSQTSDMFKSAMIACEIADLYAFANDTTTAVEWYEKSLVIDPNCILTLNNYAYMLCELNRDIDRAEKMSAKTIQAEPLNPVYLDTYAWVYYKQGSNLSAQLYIEQAIKQAEIQGMTVVADLYEHYGFILYGLGEKEKAMEMWKTAYSSTDTPSDELKKIIENGVLPGK